MEQTEFQVLRVKPNDLEDALNQSARDGWHVESLVAAEFAGGQLWVRQTLDVTRYHLILSRDRRN